MICKNMALLQGCGEVLLEYVVKSVGSEVYEVFSEAQ